MREIDPRDVPQLMRDGKLEFGMELEFKIYPDGDKWTERRPFIGFDARRSGGSAQFVTDGGWYHAARFPLPALRDGDPVWAKTQNGWEKVHFSKYGENSDGIHYYPFHRSIWTNHVAGSYWALEYCLPTKRELSEAGYTEDQINEMTTRWGTETPRNQTHKAWQQSANGTVRVG